MNRSAAPTQEAQKLTQELARSLKQLAAIGAPTIGASAHETIMSGDGFRLLRYQSAAQTKEKPAVLIVYALVNRPWVLDLEPDRSTIKRLLDLGLDVFLIEWKDPIESDKDRELSDYISRMINECVESVCAVRNESRVNLLGVCQGGTFSLCFSALYPQKVKNLITMVTPVDFQTPDNVLSQWVRHVDLDRLVGCYGNVPGAMLNALFIALQPFRLGSKKYLDLVDLADNPNALQTFARMERWIADSPDQAGRAFAQFIGSLYQRNALIKGKLVIDETIVDLKKIKCPVLNVYGLADHLVPASASRALADQVSSRDYRELTFDGGHIGIYVSRRAQRQIPAEIAAWLKTRD